MKNVLEQPLTFLYSRSTLIRLSVFIVLSVTLFLWLFKPVGINQGIKVDLVWACLIHGVTGGLLFLLHYSYWPSLVEKDQWNWKKEIGLFVSLVVVAGLMNFLINQLINHDYHGFNFSKLIRDIYNTFLVASVPMSLIWMWFHRHDHATSIQGTPNDIAPYEGVSASDTSYSDTDVTLNFQQDEPITVDTSNLLYLKANGNYVEFYINDKEKVTKLIRRTTIKYLSEQLQTHTQFVKTHRSYMVNLDQVCGYTGNAAGLSLQLLHNAQEVPVSRSKVSLLQPMLQSQS